MAKVVIAVRGGADAKSRCRRMLSAAERADLAQAMLGDMIDAARRCARVTDVIVVTPTRAIAKFAGECGAIVFLEPAPLGLGPAFQRAGQRVARGNPRETLALLPGDLPLLAPSDLDRVLDAHHKGGVVIAPAFADGGTGAIVVEASARFDFSFGAGSFRRHLAAARRIGLRSRIVAAPTLSFDLDRPRDLARAERLGNARTKLFVRSLNRTF